MEPGKQGVGCLGSACEWYQTGCCCGRSECDNIGTDRECDWQHRYPAECPGQAPITDPCGYYDPQMGVRPADPFGSSSLPETPAVQWLAGSEQVISTALYANHFGVYQFRLCPKSEPLTEACFAAHVLPFAPALGASVGGMCCWSRWGDDSTCGNYPSGGSGAICGNDGVTVCQSNADCKSLPPTPSPVPTPVPSPTPGPPPTPASQWRSVPSDPFDVGRLLNDSVILPKDVGQYVLQWRWDCAQTAQIWANCADVDIVEALTPTPPTPPPPPSACRVAGYEIVEGAFCGQCVSDCDETWAQIGINRTMAWTPEECCAQCMSNTDCKAWTFGGSHEQYCRLSQMIDYNRSQPGSFCGFVSSNVV